MLSHVPWDLVVLGALGVLFAVTYMQLLAHA